MHLTDNMLRAMVDHELPADLVRQAGLHLAGCAQCRQRMDLLKEQAAFVQSHLEPLTPTSREKTSANTAFQRFIHQKAQKENHQPMFRKRTFWLVVSTFLIVAIAFSLTPVRAWASSVLSLFRVQRVTVIEFDPAAAESNREALAANQEQIEALMEDLRFTEGGEVSEVASVDEAAAAAGFTPRLPTAFNGAKLAVKPGSQGEFTIQRDQMQALFDALGVDINIPEEADGKTVTVDVPSAVMALEGCPTTDVEQAAKGSCTALVQMPSPTVDAPAGINPQQMGAAMLQFLGYSKDEAARLSERIDWASTLVLPIPQDEDIAYQDVSVDGVTGTYLEADSGSMLIWVKDGVIYGLRAPGGLEDMLSIVSTLQ